MATVVEAMPEGVGRGGKQVYPWGEWLDGRVWALTPGEDFGVGTKAFTAAARGAANRRGLGILLRARKGEPVYIQAVSQ